MYIGLWGRSNFDLPLAPRIASLHWLRFAHPPQDDEAPTPTADVCQHQPRDVVFVDRDRVWEQDRENGVVGVQLRPVELGRPRPLRPQAHFHQQACGYGAVQQRQTDQTGTPPLLGAPVTARTIDSDAGTNQDDDDHPVRHQPVQVVGFVGQSGSDTGHDEHETDVSHCNLLICYIPYLHQLLDIVKQKYAIYAVCLKSRTNLS